MISLETAERLKEAGLKWEPQKGDWYYNHHGYVFGTTTTLDLLNEVTVLIHSIARDYVNRTVHFAPRLDQLLAEIEKRGYTWTMETETPGYARGRYSISFYRDGIGWQTFYADSPENTVAQALIWILELENNNRI